MKFLNNLLIIILLILTIYTSNAQSFVPNFEVKSEVEFQNKKKELFRKMLFSDNSGNYAVFSSGKNGRGQNSIRKFDNQFKPLDYRFKLTYSKNVLDYKTINVIIIDKKAYHIWCAKTHEGIDYYKQEISLTNRKVLSEEKIASNDRNGRAFKYFSPEINVDYNFNRIYLQIPHANNSQSNKTFKVVLFDLDFNLIKEENYEFPYPSNRFIFSFYKPYDKDKLIVIGKKFDSDYLNQSNKERNYTHLIYRLENNQIKLLHEIKPNPHHINKVAARINNNSLLVSGVIANHSISKPSSIYFLNYDLINLKVRAERKQRIPDSFFKNPEKREQKIKALGGQKQYVDGNYYLRNLHVTSENESSLIIEQAYVFKDQYMGDMYYYDNIGVFKLDPLGNLLWTSKIIKEHTGRREYLSFYSVEKNNRIFLFYNGTYINIEGKPDFLRANDAALLCTVVEPDGNYQRSVVNHYTEEYPTVAIPTLSNYSEKKGVIIFSRAQGNVKRQKFTWVTLN